MDGALLSACGRGVHDVHSNVADEVGAREVRGEAGTELAGLDSAIEDECSAPKYRGELDRGDG